MKYSVCIDGGGTKTSFVLFSPEGEEITKTIDGSIHLQYVDYKTALKIIKENVTLLCKAAKLKVEDIVISGGLAGYGSNAVIKERFSILFKDAFPNTETYLTSDGHTALLGTLDGKDGILIIAGTGSIAYRLSNGNVSRAGGWGYLLGDEGSAYDIAVNLLKIYCKQADGRMDKTILYELVENSLNLSEDFDLVKYIYTNLKASREQVAGISRIAHHCAVKGDVHAIQLFDNAAKELALHVQALSSEEEKLQVTYVGGVFRSGDYIIGPFKKYIGENKTLIDPIYSPEYGAYLYYKSRSESFK